MKKCWCMAKHKLLSDVEFSDCIDCNIIYHFSCLTNKTLFESNGENIIKADKRKMKLKRILK